MNIRDRSRAFKAGIFLVIILAAAAIILLFVFRIQKVDIKGSQLLNDDQVKEELRFDKAHGNSLLLYLQNRKRDYSDDEKVSNIDVSLISPGHVQVTVVERNIVGGVKYGASCSYFNSNGMIILQTGKSQKDIPLLGGISISAGDPGTRIQADDTDTLDEMISIASIVNDHKLSADEINAAGSGQYTIVIGKVTINLGNSSYMDEKISELASMADKLKSLSGVLHLEYYDGSQDSIVFTRNDIERSTAPAAETESSAETSVSDENGNEEELSPEENGGDAADGGSGEGDSGGDYNSSSDDGVTDADGQEYYDGSEDNGGQEYYDDAGDEYNGDEGEENY